MLSPIITTSSYGNCPCQLLICCAISYCDFSPFPLSPITANFRESGLFGSCASCAGAIAASFGAPGASPPATDTRLAGAALTQQTSAASAQTWAQGLRRRGGTALSRDGAVDVVGDDVCMRVEQDQGGADEAIF